MIGKHRMDTLLEASRGRRFRKMKTADKSEPNRIGFSVRFVIASLDILTYFSIIVIFIAPVQWRMGEGSGLRARAAAMLGCHGYEVQAILRQPGATSSLVMYDSMSVFSTEY